MQRTLGYGVMVTLQILVLSFLVRVRVPQQQKAKQMMLRFFVFLGLLMPIKVMTLLAVCSFFLIFAAS